MSLFRRREPDPTFCARCGERTYSHAESPFSMGHDCPVLRRQGRIRAMAERLVLEQSMQPEMAIATAKDFESRIERLETGWKLDTATTAEAIRAQMQALYGAK